MFPAAFRTAFPACPRAECLAASAGGGCQPCRGPCRFACESARPHHLAHMRGARRGGQPESQEPGEFCLHHLRTSRPRGHQGGTGHPASEHGVDAHGGKGIGPPVKRERSVERQALPEISGPQAGEDVNSGLPGRRAVVFGVSVATFRFLIHPGSEFRTLRPFDWPGCAPRCRRTGGAGVAGMIDQWVAQLRRYQARAGAPSQGHAVPIAMLAPEARAEPNPIRPRCHDNPTDMPQCRQNRAK